MIPKEYTQRGQGKKNTIIQFEISDVVLINILNFMNKNTLEKIGVILIIIIIEK